MTARVRDRAREAARKRAQREDPAYRENELAKQRDRRAHTPDQLRYPDVVARGREAAKTRDRRDYYRAYHARRKAGL